MNKGQTKMTLKIVENHLTRFSDAIAPLCLKRDAFLNHVIRIETPKLAEDLEGLGRQSSTARRYSIGRLKKMGALKLHPINVVVDKSVADALTEVLRSHNVSRDVFVNRMIYLMIANRQELEEVKLPIVVNANEIDQWFESVSITPLGAISDFMTDPFHYLRLGAEERHHRGLYRISFPDSLDGLNCYLNDDEVPGSDAHKIAQEASHAALVKILGGFENRDTKEGEKS
jgi:hypothetical protein